MCPNCNSPITCSCQLKTASDGKQVCSNCKNAYEASLEALKNITPLTDKTK